jgi:hypothetical protein
MPLPLYGVLAGVRLAERAHVVQVTGREALSVILERRRMMEAGKASCRYSRGEGGGRLATPAAGQGRLLVAHML